MSKETMDVITTILAALIVCLIAVAAIVLTAWIFASMWNSAFCKFGIPPIDTWTAAVLMCTFSILGSCWRGSVKR